MNGTGSSQRQVAQYSYQDENGTVLFQTVRFEPKDFRHRRSDGQGGWIWNLAGVRRVLYRLPDILGELQVFIVEGEKDVNTLWDLGIPATCNPGGAGDGKWRSEYSHQLAGKGCIIFPDNDAPGERHALTVSRSLLPVVEAVKIVRLPGLPPKGDVSDWFAAGHTKRELLELVSATPILAAEDIPINESKSEERVRVTLRHPAELIARPISWRIEGILPDNMFTVMHARDKVGKTLLAWEFAHAILTQAALFGTFTTRPGRVVLALLDDPHDLTVQRRTALGLTECEDLRIVTPLDADLSDPVAFLADFKTACQEFEPSFIVLDALFHFAPPGRDSMNDAARMRGLCRSSTPWLRSCMQQCCSSPTTKKTDRM